MVEYLSIIDVIVAPLLLIIFYVIGRGMYLNHIQREPYYRYFLTGMFMKVFGGIAVCFVYVYYYEAGDTINFYHDNTTIVKLFLKDPLAAIRFTVGKTDARIWWAFDFETDWPYFFNDLYASFLVRLTWMLGLPTFNSFIGQTMLLSFISFFPIWRLYKVFVLEFPALQKQLAFVMFFIPSV